MSIIAIAKVKAGNGRALDTLALIKESKEKALNSGICEKFDILQGEDDPHSFSILEIWSSIESHKEFLGSLMSDSKFIEAMACVEDGPHIEYFNLM